MGETAENAMSAPKMINTIMGGTIHHNLFFHRYRVKSRIIRITLLPFTFFRFPYQKRSHHQIIYVRLQKTVYRIHGCTDNRFPADIK